MTPRSSNWPAPRPLTLHLAAAGLALAPVIWPAAAQGQQAAPGGVTELPAVSVSASAIADDGTPQHLQAPVDGGALGTRTQLETPFSTTVVTQNDIKNAQPRKLGDLFVNDASVTDTSGSYSGWSSYLSIRGLPLDWQNSFRIDGHPFLSYAVTMPYEQFESVDLLKGATGFMYGFGSPGGLLNYVTKKPTDRPVREVDVGYTSRNLMREHADLGGRAGASGAFGYRLNVTHEEGGTYNNGSLDRNTVSLALDARLADKLTWDFQTLLQNSKSIAQDPSLYTGLMTSGMALPPASGVNGNHLTNHDNFVDNQFRYYATGLKYKFSDNWTASTSFSHGTTRTRRNESVLMLTDSQGDYNNYRSDYGEAYQVNQWQGMLQGRVQTGPLEHQVVLGTSWQEQVNMFASRSFYGSVGAGSLWTPNSTDYASRGSLSDLGLYRSAVITQKALFASDTIKFGPRWSVLGGLRYTHYSQNGFASSGASTSTYSKSVATPTLAVMYHFDPQTMAYASYVESLEPGTVVGNTYANAGQTLAPFKSRQYEVGIKTDRDDWSASAALFHVEQGSQYTNGANVLVEDGQTRYQGLEASASTRLGRDWQVGGTMMLLNSRYRKGSGHDGNRVAGAPSFVAAAQVSYDVPQLPGLSLRANAKYTGSTWLRPANDISLPGYVIVNLGAAYKTRVYGYDTTFRLALNNVTNKKYWEFQYGNYIKMGDPRNVSLTASARF